MGFGKPLSVFSQIRIFVVSLTLALPVWGNDSTVRIDWKVTNPFRLFDEPRDFEWFKKHEWDDEDFAKLAQVKTRWDSIKQEYRDTARAPDANTMVTDPYFRPYFFPVALLAKNVASDAKCEWRNAAGQKLSAQTGWCKDPVTVRVQAQGNSFSVSVLGTALRATETVRVKHYVILALGDSFSSGESNPHAWRTDESRAWPAKRTQWWDAKCHRSLAAWPVRAAARWASNDDKTVVTFASFACSGAQIETAGFFGPYEGVEQLDSCASKFEGVVNGKCKLIPQNDRVRRALAGWYRPDLPKYANVDAVLLTFGGNDRGFGDRVLDAFAKDADEPEFPPPFYNWSKDKNNVQRVFEALSTSGIAPNRVIWSPYPNPQSAGSKLCAHDPRSKAFVPVATRDTNAFCDKTKMLGRRGALRAVSRPDTMQVTEAEARDIEEYLRRPLNSAITAGIADKRAPLVDLDGLDRQLKARGWCAAATDAEFASAHKGGFGIPHEKARVRWFRTLGDSCMNQGDHYGTMHPSAYGHEAWATVVHKTLESVLECTKPSDPRVGANPQTRLACK